MASHHIPQATMIEDYADSSSKRRKLSLLQQPQQQQQQQQQQQPPPPTSVVIPPEINAFQDHSSAAAYTNGAHRVDRIEEDANISISATSELAGRTVAPFLAKHIPAQYAPLGAPDQPRSPANKNPNTKYCYRHRPDLKCRRQANEPSMDQLQHVSRCSIICSPIYADNIL